MLRANVPALIFFFSTTKYGAIGARLGYFWGRAANEAFAYDKR